MQASDAMTLRLPRYEAKCVQCKCFQCGSVPLRSNIKGMELPPANILIPLERQLIALQLCRCQFLYNETLQQTSRPLLSKLYERRRNGLGVWHEWKTWKVEGFDSHPFHLQVSTTSKLFKCTRASDVIHHENVFTFIFLLAITWTCSGFANW